MTKILVRTEKPVISWDVALIDGGRGKGGEGWLCGERGIQWLKKMANKALKMKVRRKQMGFKK